MIFLRCCFRVIVILPVVLAWSLAIYGQSQSGLLYLTANRQEQTVDLFGMTAIAPKPTFAIARLFGDDARIRSDRFVDDFFSVTAGYHLSDKLRADVGVNSYTGQDKDNGTYRLGKGATYRSQHSIWVIDVPIRVYYNLRRCPIEHRWVWYVIGTVSYTNIRWKRDFEVVNGDRPRRIQEDRSFDNLFAGLGIGLRYRLFQGIELYNQLDLAFGTLRGAFRTNGLLGIKFNLNINNRYILPYLAPSND